MQDQGEPPEGATEQPARTGPRADAAWPDLDSDTSGKGSGGRGSEGDRRGPSGEDERQTRPGAARPAWPATGEAYAWPDSGPERSAESSGGSAADEPSGEPSAEPPADPATAERAAEPAPDRGFADRHHDANQPTLAAAAADEPAADPTADDSAGHEPADDDPAAERAGHDSVADGSVADSPAPGDLGADDHGSDDHGSDDSRANDHGGEEPRAEQRAADTPDEDQDSDAERTAPDGRDADDAGPPTADGRDQPADDRPAANTAAHPTGRASEPDHDRAEEDGTADQDRAHAWDRAAEQHQATSEGQAAEAGPVAAEARSADRDLATDQGRAADAAAGDGVDADGVADRDQVADEGRAADRDGVVDRAADWDRVVDQDRGVEADGPAGWGRARAGQAAADERGDDAGKASPVAAGPAADRQATDEPGADEFGADEPGAGRAFVEAPTAAEPSAAVAPADGPAAELPTSEERAAEEAALAADQAAEDFPAEDHAADDHAADEFRADELPADEAAVDEFVADEPPPADVPAVDGGGSTGRAPVAGGDPAAARVEEPSGGGGPDADLRAGSEPSDGPGYPAADRSVEPAEPAEPDGGWWRFDDDPPAAWGTGDDASAPDAASDDTYADQWGADAEYPVEQVASEEQVTDAEPVAEAEPSAEVGPDSETGPDSTTGPVTDGNDAATQRRAPVRLGPAEDVDVLDGGPVEGPPADSGVVDGGLPDDLTPQPDTAFAAVGAVESVRDDDLAGPDDGDQRTGPVQVDDSRPASDTADTETGADTATGTGSRTGLDEPDAEPDAEADWVDDDPTPPRGLSLPPAGALAPPRRGPAPTRPGPSGPRGPAPVGPTMPLGPVAPLRPASPMRATPPAPGRPPAGDSATTQFLPRIDPSAPPPRTDAPPTERRRRPEAVDSTQVMPAISDGPAPTTWRPGSLDSTQIIPAIRDTPPPRPGPVRIPPRPLGQEPRPFAQEPRPSTWKPRAPVRDWGGEADVDDDYLDDPRWDDQEQDDRDREQKAGRRPARGRWTRLAIIGGAVVVVLAAAAGVVFTSPTLAASIGLGSIAAPTTQAPPSPVAFTPQFGGPPASAPQPTPAGVATTLAGTAANPTLGSFDGTVLDAATGTVLWDHGSTAPQTPASTNKLLTSAAALLAFDQNSTLNTTVVAGDQPGTIVLVGGGDPTLSSLSGTKQSVYPGAARMDDLVAQVRSHLSGPVTQVIVDTSRYEGPQAAPGWEPGDVQGGNYAPIVPVMMDGGRLNPAAVDGQRTPAPAQVAGQTLAQRLGFPGAQVVVGSAPSGAQVLGEVHSATVPDLVANMLQISDNVLAEVMGHEVARGDGQPTTFAGATAAVLDVLRRNGFDTTGATLSDDSGLSTQDRLPPQLLAQVLRVAAGDGSDPRTAKLRPLLSGLPIAGSPVGKGTLAGRYQTTPSSAGRGYVRAKTGTLSSQGVNALAGVVLDTDGRVLVFAFMSSASPNTLAAPPYLDTMAAALRSCGCR